MKYKNILVIKHGSIGDFVMAFRAMQSIREHFPNSHLSLVTTNLINKLFSQIPFFDQIIIDERKSFFDAFRFTNYLKEINIDLVIDLQNSKRTQFYHFITRIFHSKIIINSSRKFSQLRYTTPDHGTEHVIEGLNNQLKLLHIRPSLNSDIDWLRKKDFVNPINKKFVLLIPGTSKNGSKKQWPSESFAKLSKLINGLDLDVIISGTRNDSKIIEEIISQAPRVINLEQYSDFPNFINLCDNASIIISVDTGPAHIAAYSNTPLIWIVKKSSYSITNKPYSKNTYTIEAEDMCSVTVEDIFKKILKLI
jgi:ADP-heptose:LPS heptosyltransferase